MFSAAHPAASGSCVAQRSSGSTSMAICDRCNSGLWPLKPNLGAAQDTRRPLRVRQLTPVVACSGRPVAPAERQRQSEEQHRPATTAQQVGGDVNLFSVRVMIHWQPLKQLSLS